MKKILKAFKPAVICILLMTIICGIIYPALVTGVSQLIFSDMANGSIITVTLKDGTKKDYGSELIAQEFTKPEYLIGRPMKVSNLSPYSKEHEKLVNERIGWFHSIDPLNKESIPQDLVTLSASGVDPNISPEAAQYQVARIARARNINENDVRAVIDEYTTKRFMGIFGEPSVNVLKVNLALDKLL